MPTINENFNEYTESNSDSLQSEIDSAINYAQSDLNNLQAEILSWTKVDFKTPDSINHFYRIEWNKVIFQLDQVKSYLNDVYQRLSQMKTQKFWEVSKEKNFAWTILAIQIALRAMSSDSKNPKQYNVEINWKYNDATKEAIKQFQSDQQIDNDWKPWKGTIEKVLKAIDTLLNNKKNAEVELQTLSKDIENIIEESVRFNPYSWLHTNSSKKLMTQYIMEWNLGTAKNSSLEFQISNLSNNQLNRKLKYLISHPKEPIKDNVQEIKKIEQQKNGKFNIIDNIWLPDKYTFWHNITETQKNTITNVLSGWNSPVTAKMVADSCKSAKNVPVEYLLGFMQNDSRVWTMWQWAKTHNPWNVWNTWTAKKDRWTWEKWVDACANNLQKRIEAYLNAKKQNKQWFNDFPTPEELATWKSKWWHKFFWIYMTASDWPKKVSSMVNTWVNRLKWK